MDSPDNPPPIVRRNNGEYRYPPGDRAGGACQLEVGMARPLTAGQLARQNRRYNGTGGVSPNNQCVGFRPAFFDRETGTIYLSRNPDGTPAPFHRLDGLPAELVEARDPTGRVIAVKSSLEAGFERDGRFFTRDEAAAVIGCDNQ
jgi:hypothetical protein